MCFFIRNIVISLYSKFKHITHKLKLSFRSIVLVLFTILLWVSTCIELLKPEPITFTNVLFVIVQSVVVCCFILVTTISIIVFDIKSEPN
jgi:hypothetical protein